NRHTPSIPTWYRYPPYEAHDHGDDPTHSNSGRAQRSGSYRRPRIRPEPNRVSPLLAPEAGLPVGRADALADNVHKKWSDSAFADRASTAPSQFGAGSTKRTALLWSFSSA